MKKLMLVVLALSAPTLASAGVMCQAVSTVNGAAGQGLGFTPYEAGATAINYCLAYGGIQCVVVSCVPTYY